MSGPDASSHAWPAIRAVSPYRTVRPLEPSVRFHVDVLGWTILKELRDGAGHRFWVSLGHGGARLMLSDRLVHDREELTWLYVDDVEAAFRCVIEGGGAPEWGPEDQTHGTREFLIQAPDGAAWVIAQRL